ncbi:7-cyano-7-deazaguanine synthase [Archaeoglobus veneficus]|uniref:Thiamine biosynthesis protein n=1 Tax=Archaeoglobus veneficus (strain DSM 11195 / SNP6) TaxID=693661 RepID=F2KNX2_ARCVS|nr:7-cyano-7-deazaguanine synthase [Archaeoglobus veneficus]AEA47449.1 Thiamine biosynthesis protein [Archaeoglobus veneficus SNP6]
MQMKILALLSGGIDSAVACYIMLRRGCSVEYLHFSMGSASVNKAIRLASKLKEYGGSGRIFVIPHSRLIELVPKDRYTCVYCKRGMLSIAEMLAEKIGCAALLTGDSLGQVASQTIPNLRAEDAAVRIPVLRPLIGFDKDEIIGIAKEIGTYEISIEKGDECSAVPKNPVTKAKLSEIKPVNVSGLVELVEEIKID